VPPSVEVAPSRWGTLGGGAAPSAGGAAACGVRVTSLDEIHPPGGRDR
jgi:hypothetical protein